MSFNFGIGNSNQHDNSHAAGSEAAQSALRKAGGVANMVVVFASSLFNQEELLAGISSVTGEAPLIGCTSAGAILDDGLHEESVVVLVIESDLMNFYPVKVEHIGDDMHAAGAAFAEECKKLSGGKQKIAFLYSDALSGNGTELVRGVFSKLGSTFPLVGGAAGDDMHFKKTSQYFGSEVLTNAAVGFAISGDVTYAVGADHGWKPIGKEHKVTRAEGTTLYELDGKPAFSIYEEYFDDRAADFESTLSLAAVSYPLGMRTDQSDKFMIRVPLSIQDDGSIVCGAELIEGASIYMMIGTQSSALWAAKETTEKIVDDTKGVDPRLVFVSNCIARKILYGVRSDLEIESIRNMIGENSHLFGLYSYGQIAPLEQGADINVVTCDPGFYEQSISLAVIGEQ